jgi:hypothetical protein
MMSNICHFSRSIYSTYVYWPTLSMLTVLRRLLRVKILIDEDTLIRLYSLTLFSRPPRRNPLVGIGLCTSEQQVFLRYLGHASQQRRCLNNSSGGSWKTWRGLFVIIREASGLRICAA